MSVSPVPCPGLSPGAVQPIVNTSDPPTAVSNVKSLTGSGESLSPTSACQLDTIIAPPVWVNV